MTGGLSVFGLGLHEVHRYTIQTLRVGFMTGGLSVLGLGLHEVHRYTITKHSGEDLLLLGV